MGVTFVQLRDVIFCQMSVQKYCNLVNKKLLYLKVRGY